MSHKWKRVNTFLKVLTRMDERQLLLDSATKDMPDERPLLSGPQVAMVNPAEVEVIRQSATRAKDVESVRALQLLVIDQGIHADLAQNRRLDGAGRSDLRWADELY